jgi:hypothetical protein
MKSLYAAVLAALLRIQRFLDSNATLVADINTSDARTALDGIITALSGHAVAQTGSKRSIAAETGKQRVLRNALKGNHLRPIATIAAAQLEQVPEFAALRMPPANATSRQLIAAARAMAPVAQQYSNTFIAMGRPKDFVAQLTAAADVLEASVTNQGTSKTRQTGATAGVKAEVARGRKLVKVLDAQVVPALAGNQALLTQWRTASRIGGKTGPVPSTSLDAASNGANGSTTADPAMPSQPPANPNTPPTPAA